MIRRSRNRIARTWYRADATGYSALAMDRSTAVVSERSSLSASDLPAGVAAQCDALRYGQSLNCVEVWA